MVDIPTCELGKAAVGRSPTSCEASTKLKTVDNIMSAAWGSMYVNDFNDRGRVKKVYIQGEPGSRISPQDFDKW